MLSILHNGYRLPLDLFTITSFSYFLDHQNPDFFSIFQLQIFAKPYRQTYVHQCRALITGLKHAISPYFSIVWVLFNNI